MTLTRLFSATFLFNLMRYAAAEVISSTSDLSSSTGSFDSTGSSSSTAGSSPATSGSASWDWSDKKGWLGMFGVGDMLLLVGGIYLKRRANDRDSWSKDLGTCLTRAGQSLFSRSDRAAAGMALDSMRKPLASPAAGESAVHAVSIDDVNAAGAAKSPARLGSSHA